MEKIKVVYILSQRYSGSTLLSFLLGSHSQMATIGERRKFYVNTFERTGENALNCSCGEQFYKCEHWLTLKKAIISNLEKENYPVNPTEFQFSKNKGINKLCNGIFKSTFDYKFLKRILSNRLNLFTDFNYSLIKNSLELDDALMFLDSSKTIEHVLHLSQMSFVDLKVIWLTRDPRAQVNSAIKYNNWSIHEATDEWMREMKNNAHWLAKLNIAYTSLNYESLCHNPVDELAGIAQFLNLDSKGFSLKFRDQKQHIMGNYNMRLGSETKIEERTEWLSELSENQILLIEQLTKDYREYYSPTVGSLS